MLNISHNSITSKIDKSDFSSLSLVESKKTERLLLRSIKWGILILFIIFLLPWTQNVRTTGDISTIDPDQRPQEIHTVISGRIEAWKVREGQFVKQGDTIAILSEVKDAYFDENLLKRTSNQLDLKKQSVDSYSRKMDAQDTQLSALSNQMELETNKLLVKISQTELKIENDSINYQAAMLDNSIAQYQYSRMDSLYAKGLKSLSDLERRKMKAQQTKAKEVYALNTWDSNKNELIKLRIELNNIYAKFQSNYSKILSDKFSTETNKFETESNINKLENQYSNYVARQGFNIITAPQNGHITKLFAEGIGETLKEGDPVVSFMPENYDLSVAIYVDPIDLPLINIGEHVRLQFDGWPAIVFSGWPGASYGTYGGTIYAIDQFISPNGQYRLLVKPDETDHVWPKDLRFGGGSKAMILLNDVPIWYELWRNINGFPPEFYKQTSTSSKEE
ncbi:MAG: HlyD family secretion protein [Crocinitomicaceae bacterium]|nr:HlyD family secretion protein [Crocinitomicaceae bacterium]